MLENFGNMMDMIKKVQQTVASIQEGLKYEEFESASGDVVSVLVNGQQDVLRISLNPEYLKAENTAMIEDVLTACLNHALQCSREKNKSAMHQLTADLNLPSIPGLF